MNILMENLKTNIKKKSIATIHCYLSNGSQFPFVGQLLHKIALYACAINFISKITPQAQPGLKYLLSDNFYDIYDLFCHK